MAKKPAKKVSAKLPTQPMLIGLGLAALMRDNIYDILAQGLEQAKWLGKSREQLEKTFLARGEREYARLIRDVERTLTVSLRKVKKTVKKK